MPIVLGIRVRYFEPNILKGSRSMCRSVFLISVLSFIGLAGCGPVMEQPPEQQTVADIIHQKIMEGARQYRHESGIKVMTGCIAWKDQESVMLSGINWYYYPTRFTMRARPVQQLKQSSLGDCQSSANVENIDCTCQVIDINGRNAIIVPEAISNSSLRVEFQRSTAPAQTPLQVNPPAPATPLEKLERQAGPTGKT